MNVAIFIENEDTNNDEHDSSSIIYIGTIRLATEENDAELVLDDDRNNLTAVIEGDNSTFSFYFEFVLCVVVPFLIFL